MIHSPAWAATWTGLRLAVALVIGAAITPQAVVSIGGAAVEGRDVTTTAWNYFSYFTILSNVSAVVVLVWAAVWWLVRGRKTTASPTLPVTIALTCVSTYMIITGIVYNALLRNIETEVAEGQTVAWTNEAMHVWGPLFLLLDVLLAPRTRALPWRAVLAVVAFPIVWVVYTLLRAPLITNQFTDVVGWYPYPFLDARLVTAPGVAAYVAGIAVSFVVVGAGVIAIGRARVRGDARRADAGIDGGEAAGSGVP